MSKEELLATAWKERYNDLPYEKDSLKLHYEDIALRAMDLYAKIEAIGFDKWKATGGWVYTVSNDGNLYWYKVENFKASDFHTHEALYSLYQQSKS